MCNPSPLPARFLRGVINTSGSHWPPVALSGALGLQRQAALEPPHQGLWLSWAATAFLLPLGFLTNWPPAKGREPNGNGRS